MPSHGSGVLKLALCLALPGCQLQQGIGTQALAALTAPGGPASPGLTRDPAGDTQASFQEASGTLAITVRWPAGPVTETAGFRNQALPGSAARVEVTVKSGSTIYAFDTIVRNQGESSVTKQIRVKAGTGYTVEIKAYPAPPYNDTAIAQGAAASVTIPSGGTTAATVTLAALFAPTVSAIGTVTAGSTVSITGTNFLPTHLAGAKPTVAFAKSGGGTTTASASSVILDSDTQLTVLVPSDAADGNLVVMHDGLSTAGLTYTVETGQSVGLGGSGELVYSGTPVVLAPAISLAVPGGGNLNGFRVTISNQQSGDSLACTPSGGVSCTYSASTGVLTLNGTAPSGTYETVLRSVAYSSSNPTPPTGQRNIVFNIGGSLYNTDNGHFYEVISSFVTWATARSGAAARTLFGLQGYLATVISATENEFIRQKLTADAWIGGSDDLAYTGGYAGIGEGQWFWVTGPEAGTKFSSGNNVPSPVAGRYMNWNGGEPNNAGGEHYLQFYSSGFSNGRWNDLPSSSVLGYVVEYGDMPGDPTLNLSATASVTVN